MNNIKKITPAQVFPIANKIRKEKHISMKEAYAMAKYQLENTASNIVDVANNVVDLSLHNLLVEKMQNANVKFKFTNKNGKQIITTGTLNMSKVPTNRDVKGRSTAKDDNTQVFYDVRHGMYRSYQKDKIVEIY